MDESSKQNSEEILLSEAPIKIGTKVYVPFDLYCALCGRDEVVRMKKNEVQIQTEAEKTIGMPNPLKKMNTVGEAEKVVGFSIPMPSVDGKTGKPERIIVIDNQLIELLFVTADNEITYRKGAKMEDASGDYTVYQQIEKKIIGKTEVTLKGEKDKFSLAVWNIGEDAYSVKLNDPVPQDELLAFISSINGKK